MTDEFPRVVAAAIIGFDGAPYHLPPPARHFTVIRHMVALGHPVPIRGKQGFLLSDGTFADRQRALQCARANKQLLPDRQIHNQLYSENVW